MSSDFDFGMSAMSGGFFNTAGQGAMRIIAADGDESPGFRGLVIVASNQAYETGLKSLKDLAGHSFAITAAGTLAAIRSQHSRRKIRLRLFEHEDAAGGEFPEYGIRHRRRQRRQRHSRRLGVAPGARRQQAAKSRLDQRRDDDADRDRDDLGQARRQNPDLVRRFLRVYKTGLKDYHDAFIGADERPKRRADGAGDVSTSSPNIPTCRSRR